MQKKKIINLLVACILLFSCVKVLFAKNTPSFTTCQCIYFQNTPFELCFNEIKKTVAVKGTLFVEDECGVWDLIDETKCFFETFKPLSYQISYEFQFVYLEGVQNE